ncbi:hypothetical protein L3X38_026551 [Prunus dulcis]|uniref:Transposable element protein n=1 Tax=Prunus dulcis TaxID=3755 RepID=A0AAD4VL81_PRUDU|nr:hypothetical protein L3X38_026551 [Prunus dulcis]
MSGTRTILPLLQTHRSMRSILLTQLPRLVLLLPLPKNILTGKTIGCSTRQGKLYYLDWAPESEIKVGQAFTTSGTRSEGVRGKVWLWHKRLGHASFNYLKKLFPLLFSSLDVSSFQCDTCELAKSHRVSFPLSSNKSLVSFSLIHSDVWGSAKIATPTGARSFVTFIYDCTSMTWVSLLKTKGEVSSKFQHFIKWWRLNFMPEFRFFVLTMAENFSTMILTIASGKRPVAPLSSSNTENLLQNNQSPEENDKLSRRCQNHEEEIEPFYEILPALAPVPYQSLAEEVIQVTSFPKIDNTNEISHDDLISELIEPTYQLPERKNRCKPRVQYEAEKYVFIGYAPYHKGYRCYHPPSQKEDSLSPNDQSSSQNDQSPPSNFSHLAFVSQNNRSPRPRNRLPPNFQNHEETVDPFSEIFHPSSALELYQSPTEDVIVNETLEDSKWKEVKNEEMQALQKNATCELIPLPYEKKTVGCRWTYSMKLKADGSIEIYKARLVAKGYT